MSREDLLQNTRQKAFELNQNSFIYGAIAEIGAGQEVARQFFQAGGASGSIAKTVSAYDMQMSDAIYGVEQSGRYVTLTRLHSMLDTEYSEVLKRVEKSRSPDSTFFAFGDTVAAKAYQSKKECHGWMGVRFQHQPRAEPSQIVLGAAQKLIRYFLGFDGVVPLWKVFVFAKGDLVKLVVSDFNTRRIGSFV